MKRIVLLAGTTVMLGCGDVTTAVQDDVAAQMSMAGGRAVEHSASGGGWDLYPDADADRTFAISFQARTDRSGAVKGSVNWRSADGKVASKGEVACMEVRQNRAYMVYVATGGTWEGYGTPGNRVFIAFEDNGEGAGAPPDRQSFIFFALPGDVDAALCTTWADFVDTQDMPVEWVRGNIQVR